MTHTPSLVSTNWLAENLYDPSIRILDGSWHLPNSMRNAKEEFQNAHIPGALFFDIDEVADLDIPLPHMMPSNEKMASRVRQLGINNTDHIIVYDNSDFNTSARTWFMFKIFGHQKISILNGGLQKWLSQGHKITDKVEEFNSSHFSAELAPNKIRNIDDIHKNIDSKNEQVVDARSSGRFNGTAPEPRPDAKSGHIPDSFNVPFNELINEDMTYKSPEEMKTVFENHDVDLSKPIITSCGSGVTACVLLFALDQIGHKDNALYDGSWSEWGTHPDTPVEK